MAGTDAFQVEGLILQVLSNKTYRVELANGHRLLGFVPGRMAVPRFEPGAKVKLQLSPYDLSEGRILAQKESL